MKRKFSPVNVVQFEGALFKLSQELIHRYQRVLFVDRNLEESGNFYQKLERK